MAEGRPEGEKMMGYYHQRGESGHSASYFNAFMRRSWWTWFWAGLIAVSLNLLLFMIMPHLMVPAPARTDLEALIPQVAVVPVTQPNTKIERKVVEPEQKAKPVEKPQATPRQPVKARLSLPFEINPRLPATPDSLPMPDIEELPLISDLDLPDIFDSSQLDAPISERVRIPPDYPLIARRRGIEGWVRVQLIVDKSGHVDNVEVLAAEPPGIFDESVRRCVLAWQFQPGTVEGVPVRSKVETTVRFTLE